MRDGVGNAAGGRPFRGEHEVGCFEGGNVGGFLAGGVFEVGLAPEEVWIQAAGVFDLLKGMLFL